MKIVFERDKCIGCGSCAAVCPKNWHLANDGKSELASSKKSENDNFEKEIKEAGCNQEAANGCPAQCIHIVK